MGSCRQKLEEASFSHCGYCQVDLRRASYGAGANRGLPQQSALTVLPCGDEGGIESLTPGHFLIGRPVEALPDPESSYHSPSLLKRWHLCQSLVRHLWQRWVKEYLTSLQRISKWHSSSASLAVGDVVILHEDTITPTKWPHPGKDGVVRVVTVRTGNGSTYTRPVVKAVPLLPMD